MKKELIEMIIRRFQVDYDQIGKKLRKILEEELPDFQRIDEERINAIHERLHDEKIHRLSTMFSTIQEYNSTLPQEHKCKYCDAMTSQPDEQCYLAPALVPLPKDMPDWFKRFFHDSGTEMANCWMYLKNSYGTPEYNLHPLPKEMPNEFDKTIRAWALNDIKKLKEVWDWIVCHYGTPEPKPNLPNVEELDKIIGNITVPLTERETLSKKIAQQLHDKYSLHPREWWQDLKKGERFKHEGEVKIFTGIRLQTDSRSFSPDSCTPYTTPTADDIIKKHNLSEEEVRVIREGTV